MTINPPPISVNVGTDELGLVLSRIENRCAEMTAAMKMANTTSLQFAYITWEIEQLETRDQKIEQKKLLLLKIPKERRTKEQSNILDSLVESQNKNYERLNSRRNLLLKLVTKLEQQVMRNEPDEAPRAAAKVLVKPAHQPDPSDSSSAEHVNENVREE